MGKKMAVTILVTPIELELDILPLREAGKRSFCFTHLWPRLVVSPAEGRRGRKSADQAYRPPVGQEQRVPVFGRCDGRAFRCGELAAVGCTAFGNEPKRGAEADKNQTRRPTHWPVPSRGMGIGNSRPVMPALPFQKVRPGKTAALMAGPGRSADYFFAACFFRSKIRLLAASDAP